MMDAFPMIAMLRRLGMNGDKIIVKYPEALKTLNA